MEGETHVDVTHETAAGETTTDDTQRTLGELEEWKRTTEPQLAEAKTKIESLEATNRSLSDELNRAQTTAAEAAGTAAAAAATAENAAATAAAASELATEQGNPSENTGGAETVTLETETLTESESQEQPRKKFHLFG